jgi:hypothetical protein
LNELYAVDPAIVDPRRLRALLERFKATEGRFIGEFPSDWRVEVGKKLNENTIEDKQLFERFWNWSGLLGINERYSDKEGWVANAIRLKRDRRLFEMIFGETTSTDGSVTAIDKLVNFEVELKGSREAHISSNPDNYATVCWPLFVMSKEIVLYDYRFSTQFEYKGVRKRDDKRLKVLGRLISAFASTGSSKRFLLVMNEKHVEPFKDYLREDLTIAKRAGDPNREVDFRYVLDNTKFPGASGHPRCIFSVKAGLKFDQGFQSLKDQNHVSWFDTNTLEPFQKKLIPYFHRFSELASVA